MNDLETIIVTKGKLPDRKYEVAKRTDGRVTLKPSDNGCGWYPGIEIVTFRTWIVGDDGLTDIERELKEIKDETTN